MNVREKKSLCYYCYSSYHTSTGTIKVGCGIDPSKKDEAMEEITRQLEAMKRGEFSESEIETAKHTLCSNFKQINDGPASIEAFRIRRMLAGTDEEPEDCIEKIAAVTKEEIISAANKIVLDTVYFLNGSDTCEEDEYDE
jgi:predicted Zn-dependent peptidase